MPDVSPAQAQGSLDALYHGQGQGRRPVDARNVHGVREHGSGPRTPLADPSTLLRTGFFNRSIHILN